MTKSIKPILFAVIALVATVLAAYVINLLDQIVHVQLYNFDLKFDLAWANPYWNLLHILHVLLCVIAVSTVANVIFTVTARKPVSAKKPSERMVPSQRPVRNVLSTKHAVEKETILPSQKAATLSVEPVAPTPTQVTPSPVDVSGLTKCLHCGKLFSQPLQMLDFRGDMPRIMRICPYCNEIIPTTVSLRQDGRTGKQ